MQSKDISAGESTSTALKLDFLYKEALIIILSVGLLRLGNPGCLLVGAILLIWAMRSSTSAMQSLSLLVLLSFLNPLFSPVAFPGSLKWLIIFVSLASAIYHKRRGGPEADSSPIPRWVLTFIFFFVISLLLSFVSSYNAEISVFKLITFGIGVFACMIIFSNRALSLRYALSWLYTLHAVVLLVSFPMILVSSGYYPRTEFFMGMLNQSQSYGIYVVPFTTLLLIKWLADGSSTSRLEKSGLPDRYYHPLPHKLTNLGWGFPYIDSSVAAHRISPQIVKFNYPCACGRPCCTYIITDGGDRYCDKWQCSW